MIDPSARLSSWNPSEECSESEAHVLRLCKKQKLWGFLRRSRHLILDDEVRQRLAKFYTTNGPGRPPVAPERLALAMLMQVAFGVADHEVPTLTAVDRRWQVILDCLGVDEPIFSQGTLFNFREKARKDGFMRFLLDKTVSMARATRGFSDRRLRAIFDSSPLVGAGRVEDTFNRLGHAIVNLVAAAAQEASRTPEDVTEELGLIIGSASSVKTALDVDWREPKARAEALQILIAQFERVQNWLNSKFDESVIKEPPLVEHIAVVERILSQDTEPDPDAPAPSSPSSGEEAKGAGLRRIKEGGSDRVVSLSDPDMRFGRKSSSRVFAGYKRHIVVDADVPELICAVDVMPASRPEHEAAAPLLKTLADNFTFREIQADRGYLPAEALHAQRLAGVPFISKPPAPRESERFTKSDFAVDFTAQTATCPAGVTSLEPRQGHELSIGRMQVVSNARQVPVTESAAPSGTVPPVRAVSSRDGRGVGNEGGAGEETRACRSRAHPRANRADSRAKGSLRGLAKNQFDLERAAVMNNLFVLSRTPVLKAA